MTKASTPIHNKSEALVAVAGLTEDDPRYGAVVAALSGSVEHERAPSLRLLRMSQAAKESSLSRTTLWRAIAEGRLRAVEVRRGSRRIAEEELRRFVEGR